MDYKKTIKEIKTILNIKVKMEQIKLIDGITVLEADAFEYFKENGVFNTTIAKSYCENILSKGGSADPMELYIAFRGKKPSTAPLLKKSGLL